MLQKNPNILLKKLYFVDTISRRTYFWDTTVPCGSKNSHNVVILNPDEDKYTINIQHHIRTKQFQELLTKMDIIQRQSIDQNLRNLAETAGFSDIYAQDYSGYFNDIKD